MRNPGNLCRQFSHAEIGFDEALMDTILLSHGGTVLEWFVSRFEDYLAQQSSGLVPILKAWPDVGLTRLDVLTIPFGEAVAALEGGHAAPAQIAVELGLLAARQGIPGRWSARIEAPATLYFARWRLPEAQSLSLESDGEQAELRLTGKHATHVLSFERESGDWQCHDAGLSELPHLEDLYILTAADVSSYLQELAVFRGNRPVDAVTPGISKGLADGMSLLALAAPHWENWTKRMVKQVLVLHPPDEARSMSGTSSEAPGFLAITLAHDFLRTAEMLVHEASHLYFHIAELVGPVHDGSDSGLYYSPVVGRERPLDRILIAFHAFGNVLLFYRALLHEGFDCAPKVSREVERLQKIMPQMEAPFKHNQALTDVGAALFEPLSTRLAETA